MYSHSSWGKSALRQEDLSNGKKRIEQIGRTFDALYESVKNNKNLFPRTADEKGFVTSKASWWCSGFFPGTLWYLYEYSHDKKLREAAEDMTERLNGEVYNKKDHDIGFKINCSFGNSYRLTHNETYKKQIIRAARFNKTVGCTRSWDRRDWGFCVIIDNMMNMELLNVLPFIRETRRLWKCPNRMPT